MTRNAAVRIAKPIVFLVCLGPFAWFVFLGFTGGLGVNPVEAVIRGIGDWALRFLLIALAVTPLRLLTGVNEFSRFRRMLGLFAFFYAFLHILAYLGADLEFDLHALWLDVLKRKYITVGMASFLILIVLAATSTAGSVRRLGGKAWRNLHRLVYAAGCLAVLHYFWMVKRDVTEPLIYGAVLAGLLALRAVKRRKAGTKPAAIQPDGARP